MTINCIKTRLHIIEQLWQKEHNAPHIKILLQQLNDDIVFMCDTKLPQDLDDRLSKLSKEVNEV